MDGGGAQFPHVLILGVDAGRATIGDGDGRKRVGSKGTCIVGLRSQQNVRCRVRYGHGDLCIFEVGRWVNHTGFNLACANRSIDGAVKQRLFIFISLQIAFQKMPRPRLEMLSIMVGQFARSALAFGLEPGNGHFNTRG